MNSNFQLKYSQNCSVTGGGNQKPEFPKIPCYIRFFEKTRCEKIPNYYHKKPPKMLQCPNELISQLQTFDFRQKFVIWSTLKMEILDVKAFLSKIWLKWDNNGGFFHIVFSRKSVYSMVFLENSVSGYPPLQRTEEGWILSDDLNSCVKYYPLVVQKPEFTFLHFYIQM